MENKPLVEINRIIIKYSIQKKQEEEKGIVKNPGS